MDVRIDKTQLDIQVETAKAKHAQQANDTGAWWGGGGGGSFQAVVAGKHALPVIATWELVAQ